MKSNYYAHSPKSELNVQAQAYEDHIHAVIQDSAKKAKEAGKYSALYEKALNYIPVVAAEFHDFGKLADKNQEVLQIESGKRLAIQHEDAGAYHLINKFQHEKVKDELYAAWLIFSHHKGLNACAEQKQRKSYSFRSEKEETLQDTENNYEKYIKIHQALVKTGELGLPSNQNINGLFLRIALSCLVDADHGDTAKHYGNVTITDEKIGLNAASRIKLLDNYVEKLTPPDPYKVKVYDACKDASTDPVLYNCDAPVGSGKTTAVMRHLLQAAYDKKLRRVFVVLPYTNIINQSVDVYRKCLVMDGENNEQVVAAHHHKADYQSLLSRQFAETWNSPVVVTTAVQFFETLAGERPSALRKLHNIAGSAIFIDESHASLPAKLWPAALKWLNELANNWGCHIVFASGSPICYWEMEEFYQPVTKLPELIPEDLRRLGEQREQKRINYKVKNKSLNSEELCNWILEHEGSQLVILNTVQSAAYIAYLLKEKGTEVYHLSSALTPCDREITLKKIKHRLEHKNKENWTLVATSIVEAGIDLSFDVGFRERCSLSSFIQTSGRINRKNDIKTSYDIWDFTIIEDGYLKKHPAFNESASVLEQLFSRYGEQLHANHCTESMLLEIRASNADEAKNNDIIKYDNNMNFSKVSDLFKVIDSNTRVVLIDKVLASRIENYDFPTKKEIMEHSIQIWENKLKEYAVTEIRDTGIFRWDLGYDNFLGYMQGLLPLIKSKNTGVLPPC